MKEFLVQETYDKLTKMKTKIMPLTKPLIDLLIQEQEKILCEEKSFKQLTQWGNVSTKLGELKDYSLMKEKQLEQFDRSLRLTNDIVSIIDDVASSNITNENN